MRRRISARCGRSSTATAGATGKTACSASSSRSAPVSRRGIRFGIGLTSAARASQGVLLMSKNVKARQSANLATPTDLGANATKDLTGGLNILLADVYALYFKTKNFHWHVSGPHFRDYHLMLDEQADVIFAATDPMAERGRKIGGVTLHSIGHISRLQRLSDNDADYLSPLDMLAEVREDNLRLVAS